MVYNLLTATKHSRDQVWVLVSSSWWHGVTGASERACRSRALPSLSTASYPMIRSAGSVRGWKIPSLFIMFLRFSSTLYTCSLCQCSPIAWFISYCPKNAIVFTGGEICQLLKNSRNFIGFWSTHTAWFIVLLLKCLSPYNIDIYEYVPTTTFPHIHMFIHLLLITIKDYYSHRLPPDDDVCLISLGSSRYQSVKPVIGSLLWDHSQWPSENTSVPPSYVSWPESRCWF